MITITINLRTNERVKMYFVAVGDDLRLKTIFSYNRNDFLTTKEIDSFKGMYDNIFFSIHAGTC